MLEQPDQLGGLIGRDRRHARLHCGDGLGVGHGLVRDPPFDRAAAGKGRKGRKIEALAVINHWLTITW